jgi:hypothetical protein
VSVINASKTVVRYFFCLSRFRIAAAALALVGRYIAAAERTIVMSTPVANILAGYSPAHIATTVVQPT